MSKNDPVRPFSRIATLTILIATSMAGCEQSESEGPSVTGMIMVVASDADSAEPLPDGLITLEPIQGTPGQKVSTRIETGVYKIDSHSGLNPGNYRVEVMVMPPDIAAAMQGESPSGKPKPYREIDSRFNANSILNCSIEAERENEFNAQVSYRDH